MRAKLVLPLVRSVYKAWQFSVDTRLGTILMTTECQWMRMETFNQGMG